jgi:predicted porin
MLSVAGIASAALAEVPDYPVGRNNVLKPYGQFHFALQSFDDGQFRTTNIVDITNANSRIGFYIQPTESGDGLSFQFETGLGFRPSSSTSQIYTPEFFDWSRRDLRQVQVIYKGRIGTIRLGQGSMPLDGAAESDLGGTVVVAKSTIPEANGDYIFRTAEDALSSVTIGDTFDNLDGARRMRLRYDTPEFSGLSLALAYGKEVLKPEDDTDYYDISLRYGQTFDAIKVTAAIGSAFARDKTKTVRTIAGSLSVLDTRNGLNGTIALGMNADTSEKYVYLKG